MSRPFLPPGKSRTAIIFCCVTPTEKAWLAHTAVVLGRSGSSIVREAVLGFLTACPPAPQPSAAVVMATGGGPIEGEDD